MKKLVKYVTPFLTCAAFATVSAFAAPEEKPAVDADTAAAAKALMETLKVEEQLGPTIDAVKGMQNSMLEQQDLTAEQIESAKDIMAASMEEVEKALAWDNLEGIMVRAYASVFTKAELEGLIAMFETPAGQVFIAKQGELQAATMAEMQTIMTELMPKIQERTAEAIERAKGGQN